MVTIRQTTSSLIPSCTTPLTPRRSRRLDVVSATTCTRQGAQGTAPLRGRHAQAIADADLNTSDLYVSALLVQASTWIAMPCPNFWSPTYGDEFEILYVQRRADRNHFVCPIIHILFRMDKLLAKVPSAGLLLLIRTKFATSTAPYRWPKVEAKRDSLRLHELNTNILCLLWTTSCDPAKLGAAANTPPYNPPAVFKAIRLPNYDIARVISNHIPNEAVELTDLRAPEPPTAIPPEPLSHPPAQPSVQPSSLLNKPSPNAGVYRRRAEKRLEAKQSQGFAHRPGHLNVANFPVDSSGWIAVNEPVGMQRSGRSSAAEALRDPCLLADVNGHVFADLVGRPDDLGYLAAAKRVHDLMAEKSAGVVRTAKETDAHRGVNSINEELYSTATARITKLLKELQSQVRTFPMSEHNAAPGLDGYGGGTCVQWYRSVISTLRQVDTSFYGTLGSWWSFFQDCLFSSRQR
ncbi:hypothetical protein MSAN_02332600 [Mycena sanguinolenta]|uniref:Uncharacterized protein n=1 Tax=Mycena sanguinolenta TaxID=230812 RepID=A0A8H7CGV1_9AGAR|nr:hypothetical protein MSAN_02332600 [Mycena sanguinolenta]